MSDETVPPSGKRLSDDLRAIRENRGVSLDEVHAETRIARTLIESFEDGQLYNHPNYNQVYLRSFVRAYSEAIGISSDVALDALDAALDGQYEDSLQEEYGTYLPSEEDESEELLEQDGPVDSDETEDEGGPSRVADEDASDEEGADLPRTPEEEPSAADLRPDEEAGSPTGQESSRDGTEQDPSEKPTASEPSSPDEQEEPAGSSVPETDHPSWLEEEDEEGAPVSQSPTPPEPDPAPSEDRMPDGGEGGTGIVGEPTALGDEDDPSEAIGSSPSASSTRPPRKSRSHTGWTSGFRNYSRELILGGIGLTIGLLVVLGLSWIYSTGQNSTSTTDSTPEAVVADTTTTAPSTSASTDTATASTRSEPVDLNLGETIHLTVLATDTVRNIRIRRDDDLRRPYWIRVGEAEVFPFQRQVVLQNELDDIELYLEGYPYPMPAADTVGGFEITRSDAEVFADTLRGEPSSLSVTPDTIPVGNPSNVP